ncbi:MAG TPA: recombinase family protein [Methylocystis sp.]|nr:recombinase family protein [Methylocystis sp.]
MKPGKSKAALRCAVYTRVSTDQGLEQEFNSLDNQREASEAYIKSQAHEGWRLVRHRYDDGGFSGGSMERPALKRLLDDVRARRIDVIVVYKVDRLTRSLADFAKLVELFDQHQVSFVSVTQAFNTTTSMGRLTLNVLLSFAQFEREVTGERIRDKIAASKKKGMWMGGVVPLGYRVENRALHVVEDHAQFVRGLFRRYLAIGGVVGLKAVLDQENVRLPVRTDGAGKITGGGLISRGHLYKILSNPIYVGRLSHKDHVHDGLHDPIVDRATWDRVQSLLAEHTQRRTVLRQDSDALLAGKLFDDRGNRMSPSHAAKGGRRYRYYVSQAILQGRKHEAGSVARVSAGEIEQRVTDAIRSAAPISDDRRSIGVPDGKRAPREQSPIIGSTPPSPDPREGAYDPVADLRAAIERVAIGGTKIEIRLAEAAAGDPLDRALIIPWKPMSPYRRREIIQGAGEHVSAFRPMETKARLVLVDALRDAQRWLDELVTDRTRTLEAIAAREGKTERSIRMTISLAFLSPALVKAAIDGRLPRGFGVRRLIDLPMAWAAQRSALGLRSPA